MKGTLGSLRNDDGGHNGNGTATALPFFDFTLCAGRTRTSETEGNGNEVGAENQIRPIPDIDVHVPNQWQLFVIMQSLREVRDAILLAHQNNMINDEDFAFLYDLNSSINPDIPYWIYQPFDLDTMDDAECKTEFRFYRNNIYNLIDVLQLPPEFVATKVFMLIQLRASVYFLRDLLFHVHTLIWCQELREQFHSCAWKPMK